MLDFITAGFKGYAVKYSPFVDNRIACAASANFGLVGNGRQYILRLTENGIVLETFYDTPDAVYDTAWSESNENQFVIACGDGSVKLYDTSIRDLPIQSWQEHKREVYAASWNLVSKDTIATSSWDGTIKIWSPNRRTSMLTLPTHSCTYSTAWSPHSQSVVSSVSSDSHLRIFDLRVPPSASNHLVHLIPIHGQAPRLGQSSLGSQYRAEPNEALTHDWNKYRNTVVAVAGVDTIIRVFDIRNTKQGPISMLPGHQYAVRRLAWSPHLSDVLLSGSYDMSSRIWSDGSTMGIQQPDHPGMVGNPRQLGRMDNHTEFVTGVDWCLFGAEGWVASCGWDEKVMVWDAWLPEAGNENYLHDYDVRTTYGELLLWPS